MDKQTKCCNNRAILKQIEELQRKRNYYPKIEWIPSHIGESNKILTKTMKTQITYLKTKYQFKELQEGNVAVDPMAKEGARMDTGIRVCPHTADEFIIIKKQ